MAKSIQSVASEVISGAKLMGKPKDTTSMVLLAAAVICVVVPLDISQLIFAVAGALGFSAIQIMQSKARPASTVASKKVSWPNPKSADHAKDATFAKKAPSSQRANATRKVSPPQSHPRLPSQPDVRKPSSMPIVAPTFMATDWDSQTVELLGQIAPTVDDEDIVQRLSKRVEDSLKAIIPEAEVVGFASGSLGRNKAFGVAVPEVDIVANVNPAALVRRLGSKSGANIANDEHKLRKMAIRACTDRLVAAGGFKFRRSAFRGEEPKVTLLAPASFGLTADAIPIDFSVNAAVPLYNAALLTECGQMEPRARDLILLVKRWAKDRGVCHAAKGHLSPYTWGLLVLFYLQVTDDEGPYLPKLSNFKMASGLMKNPLGNDSTSWTPSSSKVTAGDLFKKFMHFYSTEFDWRTEAVSVRAGKRQKVETMVKLPLHVIVHEDGKTSEVAPSIEDPFHEAKNLGNMTSASLVRLREELQRANDLCTTGSLAELLEPWAPPAPQDDE
jgi:hypothetical protein